MTEGRTTMPRDGGGNLISDWQFSRLSVFQISRREEGGIMCFEAESWKGKVGHSALNYHALLICEGDVKRFMT